MKISKCRNCGTTPIVIVSGDDEYPFLLKHKDGSLCPPRFNLESWQKSKKDCAKSWNDFNA